MDPSPEAWQRVQRYASWIRQIRVSRWSGIEEETLRKLRLNSPPGGWFPALPDLDWCVATSNLPCIDLFFSPHLKRIHISTIPPWGNLGIPQDVLPAVVSTISALPTSNLQSLSVNVDRGDMPWVQFKDSFSSLALRCGSSLTAFISPVPLSVAAMTHLSQLPHLRDWRIQGPPPSNFSSPFPLIFPPLTRLTLGGNAAPGWLSLFERLEQGDSTTQRDLTPLSKMKESLRILIAEALHGGTIIDVPFAFPIQIFRNLVSLAVESSCCYIGGVGIECAPGYNDDDITELATAPPQLESLFLGDACFGNTCATTVACLLSISVHCVGLRELVIHFNTTNIVNDLKKISEDPQFQESPPLPRCTLSSLRTCQIPLIPHVLDIGTVANEMIDIFPSLVCFEGDGKTWSELSERIEGLREKQ